MCLFQTVICSLIMETFVASRVWSILVCCFSLIYRLLLPYCFYYIYLLVINLSCISLLCFHCQPSFSLSGPDSCLVNNVEWEAKSVGTFVADYHLPLTHTLTSNHLSLAMPLFDLILISISILTCLLPRAYQAEGCLGG